MNQNPPYEVSSDLDNEISGIYHPSSSSSSRSSRKIGK